MTYNKSGLFSSFTHSNFYRALSLARPYKRNFYFSIFVGILSAALSPVGPALIQYTVDKYISHHLLTMLIYISIIQLLLAALSGVLGFYFAYASSWLGQKVVTDLRRLIFKKILSLNVRQFDKTPVGILCTRTIDDTQRINDIFSDGILPVIIDIASVISVLAYMFYMNVSLAFIALSPFPILIIATWFFKTSVNKSFHNVRNAVASINKFVNEQLSGIHIIKSFVAEERSKEAFAIHNEEHRKNNIKAIFAYSVFFPVVEIVSALSIGALIWWSAAKSISPGAIISFILCINIIFRPLRIIADKMNGIQMGINAAQRIFSVLDSDDIPKDGHLSPSAPLAGDIVFDHVSFEYKEGASVLKNISFSIKEGETVSIIGRTGSGKSTITSLINRIYQHTAGSISINNIPIEQYKLSYLRRYVGYVSQDVFLFSGSIYENIAFANPSASIEEIKNICKELHIDKEIEHLPGKYNFQIIEGGTNLSLGQRQLISIARVFAQNPSIVVLDEATASIDPNMESIVERATDNLLKGKTAIIIAHRYKTILKSDKILVIEKGEIKEEGNHASLMEKKGYYYRMFSKQNLQSV